MSSHRKLSWFFRLDRSVQALLLANPHGYLPDGVAGAIRGHTMLAHRDETPQTPQQWHLRAAEANLLEDERLRLDAWWNDLPDSACAALIACRAGGVPAEYREAVLDAHPGGVRPGTDLDLGFDLSGIAAAYIEMVAERLHTGNAVPVSRSATATSSAAAS